MAVGPEPAMRELRLVGEAEDEAAAVAQRNQHSEQRKTLDILGAIERVDDPDVLRAFALWREFFTDDAVAGMRVVDGCADGLFDGAVGVGDGGTVGFCFDYGWIGKFVAQDGAGKIGEMVGEREIVVRDAI
jgi:hypothetical protein